MGTRTRAKSSPVVLENIVDTGTEGTKVAVGTTAQRPTAADGMFDSKKESISASISTGSLNYGVHLLNIRRIEKEFGLLRRYL